MRLVHGYKINIVLFLLNKICKFKRIWFSLNTCDLIIRYSLVLKIHFTAFQHPKHSYGLGQWHKKSNRQ